MLLSEVFQLAVPMSGPQSLRDSLKSHREIAANKPARRGLDRH
jgi:hypothetical protein